jgi:hypothetical protein
MAVFFCEHPVLVSIHSAAQSPVYVCNSSILGRRRASQATRNRTND